MVRARRKVEPAEGESRVTYSTKAQRNEDEVCRVRIYITGMDAATGKPLPNNITKTMFIKDITVSDAAETIAGAFE